MHPLMAVIILLCAAWFAVCVKRADRDIGLVVGFFVLGVVVFVLVTGTIGLIWDSLGVTSKALRTMPDMQQILLFEVLPAAVIQFFLGLLITKLLRSKSAQVGSS
jgi:hypothetical protein